MDIRIDTASRIISASPQTLYHAFLDRDAWLDWLPPEGMTGTIDLFEPWEGGCYLMTLHYDVPHPETPGKASDDSDMVRGRFVALVPDERVVQVVEFESDDPAYAGEMTMTWALAPVAGGTEVRISCENVPSGISPEDHALGLASTLDNLAAFTE
ncbi:SRPBCC family protein [Sphingomonas sp. So64.6b]|uniref:SRPBCC family protein n=1 Tax=Sphingomonas sp. So64.6b TaxID=2997354 RepID=UPI001601F6DF|nr:SRPBCC family protein [Sphingomonas sp. So64.6b]QNA83292.1 SRPBCC family protein [Sphingomonas sp. So64.6b]